MEKEHRTDKTILVKGIKILVFALMSIFIGPILLSFAFSQPENPLYIPVLILGCLISAMAVFLIFKGLKTIMSSMFKDK